MRLQHVTIVIAAKNEAEYVVSCINSIKEQEYDKNYIEIILVDNGSTDNTAALATKAGAKVLSCPIGTIGYVRNRGAEAGSGEIIAYIDADCAAPSNWLRSLVTLLSKEKVGAVGGYCRAPDNSNWVVNCWALKKNEIEHETNILVTGTFALPRDVFEMVGGFNETIVAGEDTDISRRILEKGKLLLLSPDLSVVHHGYPKSIRQFFKRQVWHSSDYLVSRKHGFDPVFIASNIFLGCLLGFIGNIFFANLLIASLCFAVGVCLACFLGIFRYIRSAESFTFVKLIKVVTLNYIYLFGRACGLSKNYFFNIVKLCN